MRVYSWRDRHDQRDDNSMTPMIDVVFLLLIFFICASVGQRSEALLPTQLAEGGAVPAAEMVQQKVETTKLFRAEPSRF